MLNVVCVETGNYLDRGAEYVRKLKEDVEKNLTIPHRFVCVTDDKIGGVETIEAKHPGWWEKIRIFEPGLFNGQVMFLDLDTFIVGNIDHIASYQGDFAVLHDFWRPQGLGPAVMVFNPEWGAFIYQEWVANGLPMKNPRGDQAWIEDRNQGRMRQMVDILQEMHPDEIVSYKGHCQNGLPDAARIVCFHGNPRPHEARGWARAHWLRMEIVDV